MSTLNQPNTLDDLIGTLGLTERELLTRRSGPTHKFEIDQVRTAVERVQATGVLDDIKEWRRTDSTASHPGGAPALVPDLAVLVGFILLANEHSPMHLTALARVFHIRLDEPSREILGLRAPRARSDSRKAIEKNWENNAYNAFTRILAVMDPYPYSRYRTMTYAQTQALLDAHDQGREAIAKARLDSFTNKFLNMTYKLQNRQMRRAAGKLSVSIDQTAIASPTRRGASVKHLDAQVKAEAAAGIGRARRGPVDAFGGGWYPEGMSARPDLLPGATAEQARRAATATKATLAWRWMVNIAVSVCLEPRIAPVAPQLAMSATMSFPNIGVSEEAVKLLRTLKDNGHLPGVVDTDKDYFANATIERLHEPVREIGFEPSFDYRVDRLGVRGGKAGAEQIEGKFYCPAMPLGLKNATRELIDDKKKGTPADRRDSERTYQLRIEQRAHFELRPKENPDANGRQKLMCPAAGLSPTVECPIKKMHPKAADIPRPAVNPADLPTKPDKICSQTSVTFGPEDGLRERQALPYGTQEWREFHKHARNSIEGLNAGIKDSSKEALGDITRRRARGIVAAQFFVTFLLVNFNIRAIAAFEFDKRERERKNEPAGPRPTNRSYGDRVFTNPYIGRDGYGATAKDIELYEDLSMSLQT